MNKPKCCEKCWGRKGTTAGDVICCMNVACTCHTAKTTPPDDSWEKEFDEKFPVYRDGEYGDYTQAPIPHIKAFIRSTRTAAYEAGLREALEITESKIIDVPTKKIHLEQLGISKENRIRRRKEAEKYNKALSDVVSAITARLQLKDGEV